MNFNSSVQQVSGGAIPVNSVALLYSPHCGYCHKIVPEFNNLQRALTAGGVRMSVVAVDVSKENSALQAGGISVTHVPLVLIKTPTSIIEYQGNRMATEIASEAARVLSGGDALLGGAVAPIAGGEVAEAIVGGEIEGGEIEGGGKKKKRAAKKSPANPHYYKRHANSPMRYASRKSPGYVKARGAPRSHSSVMASRKKRHGSEYAAHMKKRDSRVPREYPPELATREKRKALREYRAAKKASRKKSPWNAHVAKVFKSCDLGGEDHEEKFRACIKKASSSYKKSKK